MADGDDQKSLSQSIKGRLQEGVQNSVFQDKGLLDPDAVIDEDRIVGRDDQLDDIITYLRPALQGNRPPNMLLYGPSGTGKSLIINAVCQQVLELANSQERSVRCYQNQLPDDQIARPRCLSLGEECG